MLKTAICEDNALYMEMLRAKIQDILPSPNQISEFSSGNEFLNVLEKSSQSFDLALLDIDLGTDSVSGIELAERINALSPQTQIIFISQYLEYVSDVYRTRHVWFINKNRPDPFLQKAVAAAMDHLKEQSSQFLQIKIRQTQYHIPLSEILFLEKNLHETNIYTNTQIFTTREKMSALMEALPESFVACHRSFVVNLRAVSQLTRTGLILSDGRTLPVSRSQYEEVKRGFSLMLMN